MELREYESYPDEISIVWNIDDIHEAAEMIDIELSDDDCRYILQIAFHDHDANSGISWDSLQNDILYYVRAKNENK